MSTTFENAPLVEVIAELKWDQPGGMKIEGGPAPISFVQLDNQHESFFLSFAASLQGKGFRRAEKLVPPQIPMVQAHQPVWRFKHVDSDAKLFQIGPGLFTANALPPYKNWEDFEPIVASGVESLLQARSQGEKNASFSEVSLRYIDAFHSDLLNGLSTERFVEEILGFRVVSPEVLKKIAVPQKTYKASIQMQVSLKNDAVMSISVGEGLVNAKKAVILDTTISQRSGVAPNLNDVSTVLKAAHGIIYEYFSALTHPIRENMKPKDGA